MVITKGKVPTRKSLKRRQAQLKKLTGKILTAFDRVPWWITLQSHDGYVRLEAKRRGNFTSVFGKPRKE
jgi:exoribonuclease II